MPAHKFAYRWRLADGFPAPGVERHGATVFGTFICGGGSSMGYKLAGYHHLGGVEIDPKVADVYRRNLKPEMLYVEDLRKFNLRDDLPAALYDLDVLDGSPPCTTFSMAGKREKTWGKKKRFHEGQVKQTLDDLVFVYCDTIAKLRPRVCLLENVSGIVKGNARAYCREIVARLNGAGYRVQIFALNAARMGVPQNRLRVFFIGLRDDFAALPKLRIDVDEPPIVFGDCIDESDKARKIGPRFFDLWQKRKDGDTSFGDIVAREEGKESLFTHSLIHRDRVCPTITACLAHWLDDYPRPVNATERLRISTFPADYVGTDEQILFMTGMCVPPVMTAHIADAIYNQWIKPIKAQKETR